MGLNIGGRAVSGSKQGSRSVGSSFFGSRAAGGAPAVPSGALGVWYAKDYDATTVAIPNRVASSSPRKKYFRNERRNFDYSVGGNLTTTFLTGQSDDLGGTNAVRAAGPATSSNLGIGTATLGSGTKTLFVEMKSGDGTTRPAAIKIGTDAAQIVSVTSVWQTFAVSTTLAGAQTASVQGDGTNGYDVMVRAARWVDGAVDPGDEAYDGHLYFGNRIGDSSAPTVVSPYIDLNGKDGFINFATNQTLSTMTFIGIGERGTGTPFNSFLAKMGSGWTSFTMGLDGGNGSNLLNFTNSQGETGVFKLGNTGHHVIGFRYDGDNRDVFLDGMKYASMNNTINGAVGSQTVRDLIVGEVLSSSNRSNFKFHAMALYPRALSDTEYDQAKAALLTECGLAAPTTFSRLLVAEGDSITANGGSVPRVFVPINANPSVFGRVSARGSSVLLNRQNPANCVENRLPFVKQLGLQSGSLKKIFTILIGANDLGSWTTQAQLNQWLTDYAALMDMVRADGWIVVVQTVLPRSTTTAALHNSNRAIVNPELRLWTTNGSIVPGKHADYVVDYDTTGAADLDTRADDTSLYPDNLHPNTACYALMEPAYRAVINAIP